MTNNDLGPLGLPGVLKQPSAHRAPLHRDHIHVAQTQFWSLALQREVARNTVVEVGYSGAHGVHLYDLNNVNLQGAGQVYLGDPAVAGTDVNAGSTTCNPVTSAQLASASLGQTLNTVQYQPAWQRRHE